MSKVFTIGNLVTCKMGSAIFNADIIGDNITTKPRYIIRDYALGRTKALTAEQCSSHNVPTKFKGIVDWRYIDESYVDVYDNKSKKAPPSHIEGTDASALATQSMKKLVCSACKTESKQLVSKLKTMLREEI